MAQFDIFENPNDKTDRRVPYLLDIQSDLLADLATRVVIPLLDAGAAGQPIKGLNPRFTVKGAEVIMSTQELAGVPRKALGPLAGSLKDRRDEIIAAVDFLINGF
jgi:toxin CcdB